MTNGGDLQHDLNLQGETGTDRLESGETQTADFGVIDADTQAWCTVPGHKEAGMLLDIVVTEPVPRRRPARHPRARRDRRRRAGAPPPAHCVTAHDERPRWGALHAVRRVPSRVVNSVRAPWSSIRTGP